jgi:hypothetical protein
MSLPLLRVIATVLALGGVALAPRADAAPRGGSVRWSVGTKGARCEARASAFADEVALACSAAGGVCRVADDPREAEAVALLDCSEPRARLVTSLTNDGRLASVELEGDDADVLREAAVAVARDAVPEHVLASRELEHALVKDAAKAPEGPDDRRFGLALAGRVFSGAPWSAGYGGRLLAGYRVSSGHALTLGGSGELGGSGDGAFRYVRGGAGVVLGAPFGSEVARSPLLQHFGVALEGGFASLQRYETPLRNGAVLPAQDSPWLWPTSRGRVYGQATLFGQTNVRGLRGFAGLSFLVLDQGGSSTAGALDVGLAFTAL